MSKFLDLLKGKKSYVIGLMTIGYGLYLHFFGDQLPLEEVIEYIFGGAGFMSMRGALGKIDVS